MRFIQKAKDALQDPKNREKARSFARKYNAKIDQGIDRLGSEVDKRTGGKHRDKVQGAGRRAKDTVDDFAGPDAPPPPRQDGSA